VQTFPFSVPALAPFLQVGIFSDWASYDLPYEDAEDDSFDQNFEHDDYGNFMTGACHYF
jgi:hypothetical protein